MKELRPGLGVRTVDEHRFGTINSVHACCIAVRSGSESVFLTHDSIFSVTGYSVVLICSREEVHRYRCATHSVV